MPIPEFFSSMLSKLGAAAGFESKGVMGPSGRAGVIGPEAGPMLSAEGPQTAAGRLMREAVPETVFAGSGTVGSPPPKEAPPPTKGFSAPGNPVDPGDLGQFLGMVYNPIQGVDGSANTKLGMTSGKGEQLQHLQSIYHKFSGTGPRQ